MQEFEAIAALIWLICFSAVSIRSKKSTKQSIEYLKRWRPPKTGEKEMWKVGLLYSASEGRLNLFKGIAMTAWIAAIPFFIGWAFAPIGASGLVAMTTSFLLIFAFFEIDSRCVTPEMENYEKLKRTLNLHRLTKKFELK